MTDPAGYEPRAAPPAVDGYRRLRQVTGLSPKSEAQAAAAIAGTWSWRTALAADGSIAAMGRVVGDGGWCFLIADMATLPEHQGRGLGRAILVALLDEIRERAEPGAYVTLTADPPGRRLYEPLGFDDVAPGRTGMHQVL
ncbi:GNAT family N-acetyltransferase [Agrococcus sp. SL85]|uniref:GNAT family N-acetyltransferase n=1 Tax=Agrococcus sp. SL85 TaxID=2995141 RepID=UPI00226CD150|nr:GNAT family N-acetyltransferase [Agrococcus sp. SL85]WAC67170.1 GNAT family N-acetyltransferase [Agrococcus sp. SL85]